MSHARGAYWSKNLEDSVEFYEEVIKRKPDNISYKGELANVLWHMDKRKESAKIYSDIAVPMLESGRSTDVANMLGFIGAYFPEKAKEINDLIQKKAEAPK